MKAIGKNLIIQKTKEGTTKTKGGLLLAENQREDIRYVEATIVSVGSEIVGINKDDKIFFDRHAGHKIEINKQTFHVIKAQDVVVVL
jgi:co-chaperonin GroES (HSP10)|tara:strand:+ start:425 stop:685 length:261 start_codon:yes stop_codon:yes gene_type:complete